MDECPGSCSGRDDCFFMDPGSCNRRVSKGV